MALGAGTRTGGAAAPILLPGPVPALLLRQTQVGESDLLLDLFTPGGRARALAKGAKRSRKRFFGVLLTAHLVTAQLAATRSADLWRLEAAELLEPHLGLRAWWRRWMAAGPVLELLLRVTAVHDPHPGALDLSLATLKRLARARDRSELGAALLIHLTRLARELGYGLELSACLECGRPSDNIKKPRLSLGGGLLCPDCPADRPAHPAPAGLVRGLAAADKLPPDRLERLVFPAGVLGPGLGFFRAFWQDVAGRDLNSLGLGIKAVLDSGDGP